MPTTQSKPAIAATGHRPNKLGGYSAIATTRLQSFAEDELIKIPHNTRIISGLALGWGQAIAFAALALGYPLIVAIPFSNRPSRWPSKDVLNWAHLKSKATECHIISSDYSLEAFQRRNEWMVDHADSILALWNGSAGGTANCIKYAVQQSKPITNVWKDYKSCRYLNREC